MKPKIPFIEKYADGIAHLTAARAAATGWTCACAGCGELREYFKREELKEKRKHAPMTALIKIMCIRSFLLDATLSPAGRAMHTRDLAAAQIEFERVMIRKLKLHDITEAQWYG